MTAISKSYVVIADGAVDPDSPVDTTLMTGIRDNLVFLREWLGESFFAGAVQNHNHDGVNSALVEIGPNLLRNGSFEDSSNGWTLTDYTGGSHAVQTSGAMHGKYCLAITGTSTANGGGYATSGEYIPCAPARNYFAQALLKASVANISSKIEVIWYDSALAQISASVLYTTTSTPTSSTLCGGGISAPATTAYAKIRITGGIPASGSAYGTIYADGAVFQATDSLSDFAQVGTTTFPVPSLIDAGVFDLVCVTTNSTTFQEKFNCLVMKSGWYRTSYALHDSIPSATPNGAYGKIYKNGAALGSLRSASGAYQTFTEDFYFEKGDTVQVYLSVYPAIGASSQAKNFSLGILGGKDTPGAPVVPLFLGVR